MKAKAGQYWRPAVPIGAELSEKQAHAQRQLSLFVASNKKSWVTNPAFSLWPALNADHGASRMPRAVIHN